MEVPPSVRLRITSIQHCNSVRAFFLALALNVKTTPSLNSDPVFDDHAGQSISDERIDGLEFFL
jgi:hypothetical protein